MKKEEKEVKRTEKERMSKGNKRKNESKVTRETGNGIWRRARR